MDHKLKSSAAPQYLQNFINSWRRNLSEYFAEFNSHFNNTYDKF